MAETEIIFSVQESPDDGYEARALGFSIYTQADTLDELKAMVQDAAARRMAARPARGASRFRSHGTGTSLCDVCERSPTHE